MISYTDVTTGKVSFSKNMLVDQTASGLVVRLGSASTSMSATLGWGVSTLVSTITLVTAAGWNDQQMTVTMRYTSATIQGYEDFGVLCRFQGMEATSDINYYLARVNSGEAQICKVVGTTFTVLSKKIFPLPPNTDVTIVLRAEGNAISAVFTSSGMSTVNLAIVDKTVLGGGFMGFRTGPTPTSGYCSAFTAEQL